MSKDIFIHLVSHASGELIEMVARNSVAQLKGVRVERRLWKMVRRLGQIPEILAAIGQTRGFVIHSIAATDVRQALEEGCERLAVPCMFSLDPFVTKISQHFDVPVQYRTSVHDVINEDYYQRVEAMKYTLAHDDGREADDLEDADVVIVGVSRATKTPTCMYLASNGVKAANVPLVPGVPLPDGVMNAKKPLVVGLTVDPSRLATIRSARLKALREEGRSSYSDLDELRQEVRDARRLFVRQRWPVIDATNKSIEQAAGLIVDMLKKRQPPES